MTIGPIQVKNAGIYSPHVTANLDLETLHDTDFVFFKYFRHNRVNNISIYSLQECNQKTIGSSSEFKKLVENGEIVWMSIRNLQSYPALSIFHQCQLPCSGFTVPTYTFAPSAIGINFSQSIVLKVFLECFKKETIDLLAQAFSTTKEEKQ